MYSSEDLDILISHEQSKLSLKLSSTMYEAFSISHEQSQACLNNAMARKSMKIVNKQVIFFITQYIGTCKSAYTKGYALN